MRKQIVVIGGGIAGTAAAHTFDKTKYDVTIIEKREYLGGRAHSLIVDGLTIELGAGFLTKTYTNIQKFLDEQDLTGQLFRHKGSTAILRNGKIETASLANLANNRTVTWQSKFQAIALLSQIVRGWPQLDAHAFWKAAQYDDQSVAAAYRKHSEFLEYVLQPTLNGYFYWNPEHTSNAALLTIGKALLSRHTYKLAGGLQQIPERAAKHSNVLLSHEVTRIRRKLNGTYDITLTNGAKKVTLKADGIVCATTASVVPKLFPELSSHQMQFFKSVHYSATTALAQAVSFDKPVSAISIACPRRERDDIAAITIASQPGTSRTGLTAIKVYASGTIGKSLNSRSDKHIGEVLATSYATISKSLELGDSSAIKTVVQRWDEALPYFDVGHFKRLQSFKDGDVESQNERLVFAGDYIGGPYMEGAFTSGVEAANRLVDKLETYT
jgi:protoporphyrinogen/coproporphyrinogen III oxidase